MLGVEWNRPQLFGTKIKKLIERPLLEYTFKKAEDLGLMQSWMIDNMGAEELQYWAAFDMLKNEEYRTQLNNGIVLKRQQQQTNEERAEAIKQMLNSLAKN